MWTKTGTTTWIIFNGDIGLETTGTTFSGQNGVFIADIAAGTATGPFFLHDSGSGFC